MRTVLLVAALATACNTTYESESRGLAEDLAGAYCSFWHTDPDERYICELEEAHALCSDTCTFVETESTNYEGRTRRSLHVECPRLGCAGDFAGDANALSLCISAVAATAQVHSKAWPALCGTETFRADLYSPELFPAE